jgi:hypothetical protein
MADLEILKYQLRIATQNDEKVGVRGKFYCLSQSSRPGAEAEMEGPFELRLESNLQYRTIKTLVEILRGNRMLTGEVELLGTYLYSVLLDNEIGEEFHNLLQSSDQNKFLRVELHFEDFNSELTNWPWEYLYRYPRDQQPSGYFLVNHEQFALIRSPRVKPQRPVRVQADDTPVRVLFVASSPCDEQKIEFEALQEQITGLKGLEVTPLTTSWTNDPTHETAESGEARATYEKFKEIVGSKSPHVIHFVGHGRYEKSGGQIAFVQSNYKARWIQGSKLAEDLQNNKSVRLVFLQACESAMTDPSAPYQALSSVAGSLAGYYIPAVVAMQSKVENYVANNFAECFYGALTERMAVYQAMQKGRKKIPTKDALGIPVLYLLRYENEEGILFPPTEPPPPQGQPQGGSGSVGSGSGVKPITGKVSCPWCRKPSTDQDNCSKCENYLYCPTCNKPIPAQDEDDTLYICECGERIRRQRASEQEPTSVAPLQSEPFRRIERKPKQESEFHIPDEEKIVFPGVTMEVQNDD